jgi:hypothetical protein
MIQGNNGESYHLKYEKHATHLYIQNIQKKCVTLSLSLYTSAPKY